MDCPRCHAAVAETAISCSACGFSGNGRSLQHWSNLTYLLAEMVHWSIPEIYLSPLRQKYTQQLKSSEIELGLRQPPPDAAEAHDLRVQSAVCKCPASLGPLDEPGLGSIRPGARKTSSDSQGNAGD
jgi:hypothetical protein